MDVTAKNIIVILHPINKDFILRTTQLIKCLPLTTVEPKFTVLHKHDATQTDTDKLEGVLGREKKKKKKKSALPTVCEETFQ